MNIIKRNEELRSFFNRVVDIDYDQKHMEKIEGKRKIVDFIPVDSKRIIDLGSGTGLQLVRLYEVFPDIKTTAIDISEGMLKKLKEKNISDNITIVNESFFDYDFGTFLDAVISTQALHHFDKKDKLVLYKKVLDCLRPGGVFINEDYYAANDEIENELFCNYRNLVYGPERHYDTPLTIEHEKEILKSVGFSSVEHCSGDSYNILVARK